LKREEILGSPRKIFLKGKHYFQAAAARFLGKRTTNGIPVKEDHPFRNNKVSQAMSCH
jgi:hypothetical protein